MRSEQEIRDEIETQVARRRTVLHLLGVDRFAAEHNELRDEHKALERNIARLWEDLRFARSKTDIFCLDCAEQIERDLRVYHDEHRVVLLDASSRLKATRHGATRRGFHRVAA